MLTDLEKVVQDDLDKDFPNVPKLKANFTGRPPHSTASVADQILSVADAIRSVHREIDALQTEMTARLNDLRKRLGVKS